jgi:hypothetical protein
MDSKALFVEAVRAMVALPASLREHAGEVWSVKESRFDKSYIEFLDEQIRLSPRGPEWTEILKHRRAALLPFCGLTLLSGFVRVDDILFSVDVDPKTRAVIHWEQHEYDDVA